MKNKEKNGMCRDQIWNFKQCDGFLQMEMHFRVLLKLDKVSLFYE